MLDELRLEIGQTISTAAQQQGAEERQVAALNSAQTMLWYDYEWPDLRAWADKPLKVGQRYYDLPSLASGAPGEPDLPIQASQVRRAVLRWDDRWSDLVRGIDPLLYDIEDGDKGEHCGCTGERSDPPSHWDVHGDRQFQIWPVPDTKCRLVRFITLRPMRELRGKEDMPSVDGRLIVLVAASKLATDDNLRKRIEAEAARHYQTLRARNANPQGWSNLTGARDGSGHNWRFDPRETVIRYHRPRN